MMAGLLKPIVGGVDRGQKPYPARPVLLKKEIPMATKADWVRYERERSGPDRPKRARRPRRDFGVDTSRPGVNATDRRTGAGATARRNFSPKAQRNAVYTLEDSAKPRPSRRSTRKSANRAKPSHQQRFAKTAGILRSVRRPAGGV
jgi:hypothetical protein